MFLKDIAQANSKLGLNFIFNKNIKFLPNRLKKLAKWVVVQK
jgi:hypothetical protein